MADPSFRFTKDDVGCWIDGVGGHRYVRHQLAELIAELPTTPIAIELAESLADDTQMPDDLSDEDEALDLLQTYTEDGLSWSFDGGDLLLLNLDEEVTP